VNAWDINCLWLGSALHGIVHLCIRQNFVNSEKPVVGSISLLEVFQLDVLVTNLTLSDSVISHHFFFTLCAPIGHFRESIVN
jgi:hypothetical protein